MPQLGHPAETAASRPDVLNGLPAEEPGRSPASSPLSGLPHKVQRNVQDYGWLVAAKKTLAYLFRAIYFRQIYRIYRIDLTETRTSVDSDVHNLIFKILTPQNVDMIAQIENIAEWLRGKLSDAIAAGHPCLVALDKDRVAGFNLINTDHATLALVNLTKKLRKGCAWSEHIAVRKEYRKTGLGAQLRFRIFQELKKRGFQRLYGGTLPSNTASLSLARSVGFQEVADVHYRKFLTFQKWRYKRVRT